MNAGPGVPPRPLLVLLALVLLVHGLALEGAPAITTIAWPHRGAEPLMVRTISPAPAPSAAVPARRSPPASRGSGPAAAAPVAPPAVALPGSARWHYTATALHRGALLAGHADLEWRRDDRSYEARLRIEIPPLPLRVQHSAGELDAQGLAPRRYAERWRGEAAAHFERDQGRIVFSGQQPPAPLRPGAQDRLSVLLQLGALVAARPQPWSAGDQLVLQTATAREAADWRFVVEDGETLALPAGPTAALKLTRAPRHEYDARLELWFAPGAAYGPVRLRLTAANGDWLELQWSGTDKR